MDRKELHLRLTLFARERLEPGFPENHTRAAAELRLRALEHAFVEEERAAVAEQAAGAPGDADAFVRWFEALRETGPGQGDPFFPWLAGTASLEIGRAHV